VVDAAPDHPDQPAEPDLLALIAESQRRAAAGDWGARALAVNERLFELQPRALGVRLRLAGCLHRARRYDEALAHYEAIAAESTDETQLKVAKRHIGELHEAFRARRTDSFPQAQERALGLRRAGKPELAVVWHRRAAELAPAPHEQSLALASWASTLRGLRRIDEARTLAEQAVRLDHSPATNKAAHTVYVAVLADAGATTEAVRYGDALVRAHPRDPVVLKAAGRAYLDLAKRTGDDSLRRKADYCFTAAAEA